MATFDQDRPYDGRRSKDNEEVAAFRCVPTGATPELRTMSLIFGFIPLLGCNTLRCDREAPNEELMKAEERIRASKKHNQILQAEKEQLAQDKVRLGREIKEKQRQIGALLEDNAKYVNERGNIIDMLHRDHYRSDYSRHIDSAEMRLDKFAAMHPGHTKLIKFEDAQQPQVHAHTFLQQHLQVQHPLQVQQPPWLRDGPSRNAAGLSPVPRAAAGAAPVAASQAVQVRGGPIRRLSRPTIGV
jgi:hypothetical protein